jgi:threonine synthase
MAVATANKVKSCIGVAKRGLLAQRSSNVASSASVGRRLRSSGLATRPAWRSVLRAEVRDASAAAVAGLYKLVKERVIEPGERAVCILTAHLLKDPTATVAYHTSDPKTFDDVLGKRGVKRATFANRAVQVPNDLAEIVKAIELFA